MKKLSMAAIAILAASLVNSQEKEGTVMYERVSQVQIQINDGPEGMSHQLPRTRTDKFELIFGNEQSLWKAAEQENEDDNINSGEGMQIRMIVAGSDDVLFTDIAAGTRVEKREFLDKKFIINDSLRPMKWKMTGETKSILDRNCMKAIATETRTRTLMNMENGKMERREVTDTLSFAAWFTTEIPVSTGPAEYQGQLPGLILELDINNGRQLYRATQFSPKADLSQLKAPEGKKHYTPAEFREEREKMLEEMQKNNRGGNRVIRMN